MYFPEGLKDSPFKSDSHRVVYGGPGFQDPLGGSPKNLMIKLILGINCTEISELKINTGSAHI